MWIVPVFEFGLEMLEFGDILLCGFDSVFILHISCTYRMFSFILAARRIQDSQFQTLIAKLFFWCFRV